MAEDRDKLIGERVRARRKARGMTMKDLAAVVGVHFTTIGKLETGKMRFTAEILQLLANALDVQAMALLNERFSPENLQLVPVYANLGFAEGDLPFGRFDKVVEVPAFVAGKRPFGVLAAEQPKVTQFSLGHWYMIIDPDSRSLVDGGLFAIRHPGSDHVLFAVLDLTNASLCYWPDARICPLGATPFDIVGRVSYQARAVSPAAGRHLEAFNKFAEKLAVMANRD